MKITFLGTGTSVGIPAIGCGCPVCRSSDPRDRRRRASLYAEADGTSIVIDTPPDFREQVLAFGVPRVDAVLITHVHADHVFGFDDIRRFNTLQGGSIPVFGSPDTMRDMERIFSYVHNPSPPGTFRPQVEFRAITGPFRVGPFEFRPVPVVHNAIETFGFRFEAGGRSVGYVPDCWKMPESSRELLEGVEIMILDGLRHRPHSTHSHIDSSLKLLARIGAPRSFLTHMCHDVAHAATQAALPEGVALAHDGLTIQW